jgi:Leucine-rich repeat (LRR) protein
LRILFRFRLVLTGNRLRSPLTLSVFSLPSLRVLLLDRNDLDHVPEELAALAALERLSLAHNRLRALPHALGSLRSLRVLHVQGNQLEELPPALGECAALEELDASSNKLTALPPALGSLRSLKTLVLDRNAIGAVPAEVFRGCLELRTLSLHDNPLTVRDVEGTDGYAEYEARRRAKFDKAIGAGVLLGAKGLDEGIQRNL